MTEPTPVPPVDGALVTKSVQDIKQGAARVLIQVDTRQRQEYLDALKHEAEVQQIRMLMRWSANVIELSPVKQRDGGGKMPSDRTAARSDRTAARSDCKRGWRR